MSQPRPPIIGITLDHENGGAKQEGHYSLMPYYAVRQNYCDSVSAAGGLPLPLPHEPELAAHYLHLIDGLLVTGGNFDVDPALFGHSGTHERIILKPRRTWFENAILKGCLEQKKPILGICGGEQLLNVALGGTLHLHIPDSVPNALEHEQPNPRTEAGHEILVTPGTLLHRIAQGKNRLAVNTAHHQAVAKPAPNCVVNATTVDGVIEGIEATDHPFCLGVQWHPEYHINPADTAIFDAFIAAAKGQPA